MSYTRHAACYIIGVPPDRISQSSPEVMAELEAIFADYTYSPNSIFGDLIGKIGGLFHQVDPLGIVEKENPNQLGEYFPEADMVIWLHFSKKLTPRTFWAVWEYQFADSNPYANAEDGEMSAVFEKMLTLLSAS